MRKLMLLALVAVFALSAGAVLADVGVEDGLINPGADTDLWPHPNTHSGGTVCETFVETSGGSTWSGIYDYDDYRWICETGSDQPLMITCDIEMYCSVDLDATDVYFHIADNTTYLDTILNGTISTNSGQYLGIVVASKTSEPTPPPPALMFIADGWGRDRDWHEANRPDEIITDIPVSLLFRWQKNDSSWTDWDAGDWGYGNNGQDFAWWWAPITEPCTRPFEIKVDIEPAVHQADGHYDLDPAIVAAPIL